ncbi:hypothetical protein GEV27_10995 [Aeromicrobium sp. S22]|uniref:endonuclease/exonuclease/phosphatase family protein n=1 Tax=Aeromicrobium sp. S22 TaxID=2662029 RepID=UPI00129D3330|nr:endonuclease/exonuclease/phosphatase family protein [Aeromicrobium sp. S22]MRK02048.1 hypothetical protein [Aeromicrobium sp. S22]
MRTPRGLVLLVTLALALVVPVVPASAAPARPSAPYVVASSPHSLTVTWPAAKGAKRYRVAYSRSHARASTSSATTRSTTGRSTRLTVGGLRPGTTYCLTVRAIGRGGSGARSSAHCHATMPRANKTSHPSISVVTYNLCSTAQGCGRWSLRREAIFAKIKQADADIVSLQESGLKRKELRPRLEQLGYRQAHLSRRNVMYYRAARLVQVKRDVPIPICLSKPYTGAIDYTWIDDYHWDMVTDKPYRLYKGTWYYAGDECPGVGIPAPFESSFRLPHGRPADWIGLRDRLTGDELLAVNVHLTPGRTAGATRRRKSETAALVRHIDRTAKKMPVVLTGDFNSDRTRSDDVVGRLLGKAGLGDAYQRSATYTRPYLNSYNGYRRTPNRNTRWGGHIDRIFVRGGFGVTGWEVMADLRRGRYVGARASDHNPVRARLFMPSPRRAAP